MRYFLSLALAFVGLLGSRAAFAIDAAASKEIDYLIRKIETSDVRFIRNGQEYSAQEGAEHMRDKLARAGDRVKTADDFIKGVASSSYFSGKPYQMKTKDGKVQPVGPWLSEALAKYRELRR